MFCYVGAISIALLGRPQGPSEEPAAGRPHQTLRQPQERRSGHQRPQVVLHHRLDLALPQGGSAYQYSSCYDIILSLLHPICPRTIIFS